MKRKYLLPIICLLLTGCATSTSSIASSSKESHNSTNHNTTEISSESSKSTTVITSEEEEENSESSILNSSSTITNSLPNTSEIFSSSSSTTNSSSESSSSNTTDVVVPPIKDTDIYKNPRTFPKYDYTFSNTNKLEGTMQNASLSAFDCQGYANGVTGGGNLKESDKDYIKVSTAKELLQALGRKNYNDKNDTTFATRPTVIEVLNDIDLGWNLLDSEVQGYSDIIKANAPSTHPTLKRTGVSLVYITGRQNLTIFSKNGAKLSHACFQIRGYGSEKRECKNVMIRNLCFDGIWEWDDSGKYDNNDWDQFTIRGDAASVNHIWIDHCTFKKTYDGTIDLKYGATDITISWCSFLPYTSQDQEFMEMMNYLENNRSSFPNYNAARNSGASFEDMIDYASINKKVHLIGHSDDNPGDENIRVNYCNNYYLDCVERLPRLRLGNAHVFNNIYDASETEALKMKVRSLSSWPKALGFSENGSQGTNKGHLLMENCYINGINTPLRNNMKKVDDKYVGSVEALYTYYTCQNISRSWDYSKITNTDVSFQGRYTFKGDSVNNEQENLLRPFPMLPKSFNTHEFKQNLNYEYTLYDPETLYITQNNKVGANAIKFSTEQWLKSTYGNEVVDNLVLPTNGVKGSTTNLNKNRA